MKNYLIFSPAESLIQDELMYWSNAYGWQERDEADIFTEAEKEIMNLPDTGIWVECEDE